MPEILADAHAEPSLALDAGQVTAAREHWVSSGRDPARFDAAVAGEAPAASPPQPEVAASTNSLSPGLPQAEAAELAQALLDAGVPREAVEEALREDGYTLPADDARTEEERESDALTSGAEPTAYEINYRGRTDAETTATDLAAFNKAATAWLSQAGFAPQIGPAVVERILDAGGTCMALADGERQLWVREQASRLEELAGGLDEAAEALQKARAVLDRGDPAFAQAIRQTGALNEAGVVMHLARHADRLALRRPPARRD